MVFKYWGKAEKDGPGYHLLPYHYLDVGSLCRQVSDSKKEN